MYPAYISKYNSNPDKKLILLMIWNIDGREAISEGQQQWWHYLAANKLQ